MTPRPKASAQTRPRIWFKQDMAKAILNGKKTSTTRDHERKPGVYLAVMGDYYHAIPFASIRIEGVEETTWAKVFEENWREEGFNSPGHMRDWCAANGLAKASGKVYLHRFILAGVPYIVKTSQAEDGA